MADYYKEFIGLFWVGFRTVPQYNEYDELLRYVNEELLETISYYNHASNWRSNFGRINTINNN